MLRLKGVETFYGESQALFGVDFAMEAGEVVTLLGRNGMGKTTTVKAVMGLARVRKGTIAFEGKEIQNRPSYAIARLGLGLAPEGRRIFKSLTVRENLLAVEANYKRSDAPYDLAHILTIFPKLGERLDNFGDELSGGEQQMLSIARALMTNPKLLILDEATEGLAPLVRQEIWRGLAILKARGESILVIDKHLKSLLAIADRHHILHKGRIAWQGTSEELAADRDLQSQYLGV